jgi:hypothetical protein
VSDRCWSRTTSLSPKLLPQQAHDKGRSVGVVDITTECTVWTRSEVPGGSVAGYALGNAPTGRRMLAIVTRPASRANRGA